MICKQCGKDLPEGSAFCKYCGAVLWGGAGPGQETGQGTQNQTDSFANEASQPSYTQPSDPWGGAQNTAPYSPGSAQAGSAPTAEPYYSAGSPAPQAYPQAGYTPSYSYSGGSMPVKRKTSVWSIVVMSILGALLLLVGFFTVASLITVGTQEGEITALEKKLSDRDDEIALLQDRLDDLEYKVDFYDDVIVFVMDDGTDLYHSYDCDVFLDSDEDFWAFNKEQAKGRDFDPCPQCQQ